MCYYDVVMISSKKDKSKNVRIFLGYNISSVITAWTVFPKKRCMNVQNMLEIFHFLSEKCPKNTLQLQRFC